MKLLKLLNDARLLLVASCAEFVCVHLEPTKIRELSSRMVKQ